MAIDQRAVQEILEHVFARQDMIEACEQRDVGAIIRLLAKHGITQGKIASLTGIAQGRLSEYKTGKRVPSATSTFEAIADGLGMPANARRAFGLAPSGDSGISSGMPNGNALSDSFDIQVLAAEVGRRGSMKRREMLELAATIGTAAAIGRSEIWERLSFAISGPVRTDAAIAQEMENRTAGFHRLDLIMPSSSLYKAIIGHLNELGTLLNRSASDPKDATRIRLIVTAGESAVLAGWWASDMGSFAAARNLYETAERAALEADDHAITACLLACRSYIPSSKGAHGRSRALLTSALEVLPDSVSPTTEAWLAARHAEESAALEDRQQALVSLGRAEEAFNIADPEEDRSWAIFFDQSRFDSCRISTYANIPSRLGKAEAMANEMLASVPELERKRVAIVLGDIAAAHLRHGHTNEACRIAKDGLAAVRESDAAIWLPKFEAIGKAVAPLPPRAPIRAFLEELALTKRQVSGSA